MVSSTSSSSSSSGNLEMIVETLETITNEVEKMFEEISQEEAENSLKRKRRYIQRDRQGAHNRLMRDYFIDNATFQGYYFRRRFRMRKNLFQKIVEDVTNSCSFFRQRTDARGTLGFSPLQKCTAALRMLAYGTPPDALDENLQMSARTARDSLDKFCKHVLKLYGPRYLRKPTYNDVQQLYAHHSNVHGLPGMLGSLDCMHWGWANCPNGEQGGYTKSKIGYPTVVLEAVASQDTWIWHAFFGAPGALNDLNILNVSPIFRTLWDGTAPDTSFQIRGTTYKYGYYLVDGIYTDKAVFVKSVSCPDDNKRKKFKRAHERARKDVERAFGILKKRWFILKKQATFSEKEKLSKIMYTCIVLHNMILEDEGNAICVYDENEVIPATQPIEVGCPEYMMNKAAVSNHEVHYNLRGDLVEHMWSVDHIDLNLEPEDEDDDEFSDEDVYIVFNVPRTHWFLGELDLVAWKLKLYDIMVTFGYSSMKADIDNFLSDCISKYLKNINYWEKKNVTPNPEEITLEHATNVPQQVGIHTHWFLGELDLVAWKLKLYDSMVMFGYSSMKADIDDFLSDNISKYLKNINYWKKKNVTPNPEEITLEHATNVPQQVGIHGLGDCDAYVCMFLERLTSGRQLQVPISGEEYGMSARGRLTQIFFGAQYKTID